MGFDAASAIPPKYGKILADEELAGRLAFKLSIYSIDADDKKAVAAAFRSFLLELGGEKRLGLLVEMRARARGNERKAAEKAILGGLGSCGENGRIEEAVELLRREDLTPEIRKAAEKAVLGGMEVCGKGGRVSLVVELLGNSVDAPMYGASSEGEWLPEKVHVKAIGVAGKSPYVDYAKYMEAVIGMLGKDETSAKLKKAAERALVEWAIDECLDRANPDNSCALLRLDGEGRVVSENVDGKKLVSIVLGLAGNERIAEGVRVKAVEATTACQHVGRGELSDTLAELLEKEGVPQVLKGAVDKALEICGAQKFVQECSGKGLEELVGMRVTAGANERRFVDAAILERLRKLGVDGCVEELAGFLERKDLTPRLRAAGENAILEAVDMRGGGERADALLELLKRDLAPRVHIKIIDNVGGSPHADRAKLIDALAGVLGKKGIGKELKEAAEKALDAPVEECIKKGGADIGAVAILFREKGIPWSVLNRIMEACAKTDHFTKVAHVFMKEGLPQESAKIAESVLLERIDFFAERALRGGDEKAEKRMGLVVHLLWEKRLPESVYLKAIDVCSRYVKVHGFPFVEALGELFSRQDVSQSVKDAAEKALMDGGMVRQCAAAGYTDRLETLRKMLTVPDRVREKIVETYRMHRRLERVKARETDSSGARPAVTPATPVFSRQYGQCGGNEGFVDSTVRPPRDGNNGKAVDHVATGTTRKAKIVKRD